MRRLSERLSVLLAPGGHQHCERCGGSYNNGTLTLTRRLANGNTARFGGGISNDAASRVTGNQAGDAGGGIYNNSGTVTLDNGENLTNTTPDNCTGCSG